MYLICLACYCLSASYTQICIMGVHLQHNSKTNSHGFWMHCHRVIVLKGEKERILQVWTSVVCIRYYDYIRYFWSSLALDKPLYFSGYESGIIQASAFRTYHTPLNKQVVHVTHYDYPYLYFPILPHLTSVEYTFFLVLERLC